jgi:hypothetical protein
VFNTGKTDLRRVKNNKKVCGKKGKHLELLVSSIIKKTDFKIVVGKD